MVFDTSSTNEGTRTPTGSVRSSGRVAGARISTADKQLTSPILDHTHPVHHAETTVNVAKQNFKRKASDGDQPLSNKSRCRTNVLLLSYSQSILQVDDTKFWNRGEKCSYSSEETNDVTIKN